MGRLRLAHAGVAWNLAAEATGIGAVTANDRGDAVAHGYGLLALEAARSLPELAPDLRVFARIDNLFDRDHVGSVIVNEANGRYYEPGPGRSVLLGLEWRR